MSVSENWSVKIEGREGEYLSLFYLLNELTWWLTLCVAVSLLVTGLSWWPVASSSSLAMMISSMWLSSISGTLSLSPSIVDSVIKASAKYRIFSNRSPPPIEAPPCFWRWTPSGLIEAPLIYTCVLDDCPHIKGLVRPNIRAIVKTL